MALNAAMASASVPAAVMPCRAAFRRFLSAAARWSSGTRAPATLIAGRFAVGHCESAGAARANLWWWRKERWWCRPCRNAGLCLSACGAGCWLGRRTLDSARLGLEWRGGVPGRPWGQSRVRQGTGPLLRGHRCLRATLRPLLDTQRACATCCSHATQRAPHAYVRTESGAALQTCLHSACRLSTQGSGLPDALFARLRPCRLAKLHASLSAPF